jgi:hypothetical protein
MSLQRVLKASASILMLALVSLGARPAGADVIYSTFGPDDFFTWTGWTIGGPQASVQALQFIPAQTAVVETIEIAGFRLAGGTAMNVSLAADAGNQPGAVIETVSICCFGDIPDIQMANSVVHPPLTAGTKYWLVVSSDAVGDHFGWARNQELPAGRNAQQQNGGSWFVSFDWQGAMRISSPTSTPTMSTSWGRLKSLYH